MTKPKTPHPITPAEERVIAAAVKLNAVWDAVDGVSWALGVSSDEYNQALGGVQSGERRLTRAVRALERERAKKGGER